MPKTTFPDDLYCKIFVDATACSKDEMRRFVASATRGSVEGLSVVVTSWGEIDVIKNDDHDEEKKDERDSGFLCYRYLVEVHPSHPHDDADRQRVIREVRSLLVTIQQRWRAIPACDYEDELARDASPASEKR